eukprot:3846664-Prymnesium_polylepis.1
MRTGANGTRGGHGGGDCGVGGGPKELNKASLDSQRGEAVWLALGERRARALALFEQKDAGAIHAAGAGAEQHAAAETVGADSAATEGQTEAQAQAAASEAALEPVEAQEAARMELEQDEQPAS